MAPLRARSSIVLASVLYITALSLVQSLAIMVTGVGVAGAIYASGLPEVEDHQFLVASVRALQG